MTAAEAIEELRALVARAGSARARKAVAVLARLVDSRTAARRRHEETRGPRPAKNAWNIAYQRGRRHGRAGKPREQDAPDGYETGYQKGEQERLS